MSAAWNPQFDSEIDETSALTRRAVAMQAAAPASLVNRTRRVVRHRAAEMQERRTYLRSLLVPLALCSVVLTLVAIAVWSGMYQSTDAAEAIQDVASLTGSDTTNHVLVATLWFVPLTLILIVSVWVRHVRGRESDPTR